jgi:putative flippase GtrA
MNGQLGIRGLPDSRIIIKFLGTGALNTIFGYTVYAVLIYASVPYLTALFVATATGVIFNYFSFSRMVFHYRGGWFVFGKFVITYGIVYAVNAFLLKALIHNFMLTPYTAQVICIPPTVLLNWLLMNSWVFKKD